MEPLPELGEHLVILSPHDDDAAIGAGGIILQRRGEGKKTTVLVLTDGSLGYSSAGDRKHIVETRKKETKDCYALLGADVVFLDFPDMGLHPYRCWETPDGKKGAYQQVISALRHLNATSLFIPNPRDRHPDHKAAFDIGQAASFQACEPVAVDLGKPIELKAVLCYAVWDSLPNETHYYQMTGIQFSTKKDALLAYKSQHAVVHGFLETMIDRELFWKQ